ncbi:MAG: hypothetical protein KM310_02555 [Clostridiales bacterium]|nr:hypothetical protein [Clostridiales bacterium]
MMVLRLFAGGLEIRLHLLTLLLPVLLAWGGYGLEALFWLLALLVHEAAHLVVAAAYDVDVAALEILPLGGRLEVRDWGDEPAVEALVALAGPMQNLLLLGLGELFLAGEMGRSFARVQAGMAFLNLFPGLPLDGGRILRALLVPRWGWVRATSWAIALGKGAAAFFFLLALALLFVGVAAPVLVLLSYLVWQGAEAEREESWGKKLRQALDLPLPPPGILQPGRIQVAAGQTRLGQVVARTRGTPYTLLAVLDEKGRFLGMMDPSRLLEAYLRLGPQATLEEALGLPPAPPRQKL